MAREIRTSTHIYAIEGPIGVGKSSVLHGLMQRGYSVFPEPVQEWESALKTFYSAQNKSDNELNKDEVTQAAVDVQKVIVESLVERHGRVEDLMERFGR